MIDPEGEVINILSNPNAPTAEPSETLMILVG